MSFIDHNHRVIGYRLLGDAANPLLLMAHPLGMTQTVWDDLLPALLDRFRVLTWDLPGHGASEGWPDGPVTPADLATEALALVDVAGATGFHFVGTSIGGVIGQQLLLDCPDRLLSTTLTNTGAVIGTEAAWRERAERVRTVGLAGIVDDIVPRWFSPASLERQRALLRGWTVQMARGDADSYARLCEMLAESDFRGRLPTGLASVRLVAGTDDAATPPETLRALSDSLGGAALQVLAGVGHVPSVEAPERLLRLL
ncbi:MAG TPA: alpha/beta fold hydrolase [Gammaproteobacteria bacterium]|nr:alpha/beta fold hydrolase [Gammaproteobacteria bacterium]